MARNVHRHPSLLPMIAGNELQTVTCGRNDGQAAIHIDCNLVFLTHEPVTSTFYENAATNLATC